MSGPAPSWTSPAGHATTDIVGTVDSAYKVIGVAIPGNVGAVMAVAGKIALESGTLALLGPSEPSAGVRRRHHVYPDTIHRAIKEAVRAAGIIKPVSCHTLRHSWVRSPMERLEQPRAVYAA